jgi:hypothetical protein
MVKLESVIFSTLAPIGLFIIYQTPTFFYHAPTLKAPSMFLGVMEMEHFKVLYLHNMHWLSMGQMMEQMVLIICAK